MINIGLVASCWFIFLRPTFHDARSQETKTRNLLYITAQACDIITPLNRVNTDACITVSVQCTVLYVANRGTSCRNKPLIFISYEGQTVAQTCAKMYSPVVSKLSE